MSKPTASTPKRTTKTQTQAPTAARGKGRPKAAQPEAKRGRGRPVNTTGKTPPRPAYAEHQVIDIDRLPASAILRDWAVAQLLCCSRSTVWRYTRSGKLAAPVKSGDHMTGWRVSDIKTYLESRQAAPVCERVHSIVREKKAKRAEARAEAQAAATVPAVVKKPRAKAATKAAAKVAKTQTRKARPTAARIPA